ncbi:lasso peptide biosynthesis PqqD family chaperone [Streptomyces sp. NPDC003077]|uniref:lasso peptide biosynthesis PqqD family chaperone n=1 Tax=Streptomyces sp. NPDC003077 TaxID=3154443 RepID=UPI0033AAF2A1
MTLRLKPHVSLTDTETGMVVLDEDSGRYFELNQPAATALRALLDGADPAHAAALLAGDRPDLIERATTDLRHFLQQLTDTGIAADTGVTAASDTCGTTAGTALRTAKAWRKGSR